MSCAACRSVVTLTGGPCGYCGRLNVEAELAAAQLQAPGGAVSLPTPTRAALILSAKQWATAARERAEEEIPSFADNMEYIISCCERIEKALVELEGLEK